MGYLYTAMWYAVGLILIFILSKENKIFYLAGGYFMVLGTWWLLDLLLISVKMFEGALGITIKVISALALIVFCAFFFQTYRKKNKQQTPEGKE